MKKLTIALYGSHGGELDRIPFEVHEGQDASAVIRNRLVAALEDEQWLLTTGDCIKIEGPEL